MSGLDQMLLWLTLEGEPRVAVGLAGIPDGSLMIVPHGTHAINGLIPMRAMPSPTLACTTEQPSAPDPSPAS